MRDHVGTSGWGWTILAAGAVLVLALGCGRGPREPENAGARNSEGEARGAGEYGGGPAVPTLADTSPRELPGLHNVVAYHDGFWSGGVPGGDEAFATLASIGVRTVISVDGSAPDVEGARRHGLRYIHLPIGYDGFDEERELQLARATRDAMREGPVYIHCHHGKHRSAGAAGTIAVNLGWATPGEMVERMKVSGTSASYRGLFGCVMTAVALTPDVLESIGGEFPEVSMPTGLVAAMVEINHIYDHLKEIEAAGWGVPAGHPDLVPAAEAGRLENLFRAMSAAEASVEEGPAFVAMMVKDAERAAGLEALLAQAPGTGGPAAGSDAWRAELGRRFAEITASCKECHAAYRD